MNPAGALRRYQGWEYRKDRRSARVLDAPVEVALLLELNGRPVATLMALPGMERELALGFCLSEGLVASYDDIVLLQFCRDEVTPSPRGEEGAVVRILARSQAVTWPQGNVRRILSGCGAVDLPLNALNLAPLPRTDRPRVAPPALYTMSQHLRQHQGLYRESGGVHGAALYSSQGELLALAEDIGRHNAVDKVLGAACLRGLALEETILVATGRASHEIVAKAIRMRLPIVAVLSAPTSLAVELAASGGCTLIGRLRGRRFWVYTHPERIG